MVRTAVHDHSHPYRPCSLVGKPSQRGALMLDNAVPASVLEYVATLVDGLR